MELVCWKTENKDTGKSIFNVKIWEKYRNTRGKKAGQVLTLEATSKFKLAIKLIGFIYKHRSWL